MGAGVDSRFGITLLVLLLFCTAARSADAEEVEPEVEYFFSEREVLTIGVMEFASKGGITQDKADVIADVIAEEIGRMGDVRVISKSEIHSVLNLEKQKRLAGCTSDECFAKISSVLGMGWMVIGNISRLGTSFILNLKLIDVRNTIVAGRVTLRVKGDEDDLLDELPEATRKLFDKVSTRMGFHQPDRVTAAAKHPSPSARAPPPSS
jgi:TolB-like protein